MLIAGPKEIDSLKGIPNAREANMPGKINAKAAIKASMNNIDQLMKYLTNEVDKQFES